MHVSRKRITAMTALISPGNNLQGFVFISVMLCLLMSVLAIRLPQMSKHVANSLTIKQLMKLCVSYSIHSAPFPGKGLQ